MSAHFDGNPDSESCESCNDLRERDLNRLVGLAQAQAEYLARVPTERFLPGSTPSRIEGSFWRISKFLEQELLPKEK